MKIINAISFILITCLSFWGYGNIFLKFIQNSNEKLDFLKLPLGICIFIAICGYLELFHLANNYVFITFITVGSLIALYSLLITCKVYISFTSKFLEKCNFSRLVEWDCIARYVLAITALFCVAIILIYLYHLPLNVHDDFNGYLILATRILQEGYQGGDPFNDHSIEQGFGGGNYILALTSTFMPFLALHLADGGIGILLLISLIIFTIRKHQGNSSFFVSMISIIVICIVCLNAPIVNTTPLLIPCGLYLAIIIFFEESNFGENISSHFILALLVSSFLLLKGNYIIPVTSIIIAIYATRLKSSGLTKSLKEFSLFLFCFIIFCTPWMISNWQFSKTLFYPLLGHGLVSNGAIGIGNFIEIRNANLIFFPSYILLIGLLIHHISSKITLNKLFFLKTLTLVSIGLVIALTFTNAGLFTRYSYVSLFAPIAYMAISFIRNNLIIDIKAKSYKLFTLLLITVIALFFLIHFIKYGAKNVNRVLASGNYFISKDISTEMEMIRIKKIQESIPPHTKMLVRLDLPFLANFNLHNISVMDWPGNAGPKPGTPFAESPENLANYLRAQKIEYLVYSYKNEALFSSNDPELASRLNHSNPWIRTQASRTFAVQNQISLLSKEYHIVYDNGRDFVLDLNQKAK